MARLRVSLDLGPNATVAELAEVVEDFSSAVELAVQWSSMSNRSAAITHVEQRVINEEGRGLDVQLSRRGQLELENFIRLANEWDELQADELGVIARRITRVERWLSKDTPYIVTELVYPGSSRPRLEELAPEAFALLVSAEFLTRFDGPPTVEWMTYENPWEIILVAASPATLLALLVLIRDWRPNTQRAWASARKEEAEAKRTEAEAKRTEAEAKRTEAEAARTYAEAREISARARGEDARAAFVETAAAVFADQPDTTLTVTDLLQLLDDNGPAWDALTRLSVLQPDIEELPDPDALR